MGKYRCANDYFGYCSQPPQGAAQHLKGDDTRVEYDGIGKCPDNWRECPKYGTHSSITLTPPAKAKKRRTVRQKQTA